MKVNVISLCSGYDTPIMALNRLKQTYPSFDFNLIAWSEIAPNAIKAHNAVYPEYSGLNLSDMTKIDWDKLNYNEQGVDLLIYSTPCQSVSRAGARKGMKEGDEAASALIWHTRKAIEILRPKVLILENVQGMVDSNNIHDFRKWQDVLSDFGYANFAKILNTRDYGVAQNRPRLFMVSILHGFMTYHFPKKILLEKRIKDYLESEVDDKFYLSTDKVKRLFAYSERKKSEGCGFNTQLQTSGGYKCHNNNKMRRQNNRPAHCDTNRIMNIGNINKGQSGQIIDSKGISSCLCVAHGVVPIILEHNE